MFFLSRDVAKICRPFFCKSGAPLSSLLRVVSFMSVLLAVNSGGSRYINCLSCGCKRINGRRNIM